MSEENSPMQALERYLEAEAVLAPLLSGIQLLGLLRGAFASGMLTLARIPRSPAQIATAINMDESRVVDICNALDAHKVFEQENGYYQLTDAWMILTAPDIAFPFQDVLDNAFAQMKTLSNSATGIADYWTMTPNDRIALAKGVTFNPGSPHSPALLETLFKEYNPEFHEILAAGGHYLELGCGVAGGLLSFLQAYPTMTAVGVELAVDVLEGARQRALDLGVSGRVVFYEGDARNFYEPDRFDIVFWSQFFFPAASRADVLQVAFQSVKPGGFVWAPLQDDPSILKDNLHTQEGQSYTMSRVIYGGWGIPAVSAEDLQREIEAAGFIAAKLVATPVYRVIVAQRPKDI